jgi:sec-independent protein translocase protein TatA
MGAIIGHPSGSRQPDREPSGDPAAKSYTGGRKETSMLGLFETLGLGEILIILAVVLLLFGAKRLPEIARSLGRSSNEFKKGLKEGGADKDEDADSEKRPTANTSE